MNQKDIIENITAINSVVPDVSLEETMKRICAIEKKGKLIQSTPQHPDFYEGNRK